MEDVQQQHTIREARESSIPHNLRSLDFWPDALAHLEAGRAREGFEQVMNGLRVLRSRLPHDGWREFARSLAGSVQHAVLHQDPFTERAYRKPRGYAGDAIMLDLMYGSAPIPEDTSAIGATVHAATSGSAAGESVKMRRNLLATYIDDAAQECERPDVLSVAAGHLREGQRCRALASGLLGRFVALDQDARSLSVVEAEQAQFGVTPCRASIRRLLTPDAGLTGFDFIYSAGLYDYLDAPLATALTRALFSALNSKGRLLVANFAPELPDVGYMEAIMDWWLIYRDENALLSLTTGIPTDEVSSVRTWRDAAGNVVYLELRRR